MKKRLQLFIVLVLATLVSDAQNVDFTIKYNEPTSEYEVYAKSDVDFPIFFVGGGSQISLVLPATIPDKRLIVETVAGGPWLDNSQIYSSQAHPTGDFHGIASNGSMISLKKGEEKLMFTFVLPSLEEQKDIRLFDNNKDPQSDAVGMGGGDFNNYFACALTLKNAYRKNYKKEKFLIDNIKELLEKEQHLVKEDSLNYTIETDHKDIASLSQVAPNWESQLFELYQNEPNPFYNQTQIGFYLPEDSEIELVFRDESNRILKIIKEHRKAGKHTFLLDKHHLTNGIIFYQLSTKFGAKTKKMLRLR